MHAFYHRATTAAPDQANLKAGKDTFILKYRKNRHFCRTDGGKERMAALIKSQFLAPESEEESCCSGMAS